MQEAFSVSDIEVRHHSGTEFTDHDTVIYPTTYSYTPYSPEIAESLELFHPSKPQPSEIKAPSEEKSIHTLNFPLFFFWHRIKTMSEDGRYNSLFSGLVGNLLHDETLLNSVWANGVVTIGGLDSLDSAKLRILDNLDCPDDKKAEIFSDQINGLGSVGGLQKWMQLAQSSVSSKGYFTVAKDLSEYFGVSMNDVGQVNRYVLNTLNTAKELFNSGLNCPDNKCTSLFMMKQQFATSKISRNNQQSNTIADGKNLFFPIEYSAFYEDNYQALENGVPYKDLYWTTDQVNLLYDIDTNSLAPKKFPSVLPHYSNLRDLREACKTFWLANLVSEDHKLSYFEQSQKVRDVAFKEKKFDALEGMLARFKLTNHQQVEVMCGYIEHIYSNMVLDHKNGSYELFILTQFAAENMEKVLKNVKLAAEKVVHASFVGFVTETQPDITCEAVLQASSGIPQDMVKTLCGPYQSDGKEDVEGFLFDLFDNCEHVTSARPFSLNNIQLTSLCTSSPSKPLTYANLLNSLYAKLETLYGISDNNFSVTKLAIFQMSKATMSATKNPYLAEKDYPVGNTIHIWDPATFPRPFEMAFFVDKYKLDDGLLKSLTLEGLSALYNKGSVLNPLVLYYSVVNARNGDFDFLKKFMGLEKESFDSFWKYLVLFLRDFYLQGFSLKVSEKEINEGIDSPFIKDIKERQILLGGDPSILYPVNVRLQQADYVFEKYTGVLDLSKLDNFYGLNGYEKITNDLPVFDGNQISVHRTNPWKADIMIDGCDNFCPEFQFVTGPGSPELREGDERILKVYGPPLNRTITYDFLETKTLDFMNCSYDRYKLNQEQYEAKFKEYHQDQVNGFFNLTSVFNFPIMISQDHLYGVEPKIGEKYSYFDKEGKAIAPEEDRDGGFYETEQHTRAVTQMNLNLHFNLEIKEDLLFVGAEEAILGLRQDPDLPFIVPLYNLEFWTKLPQKGWKNIFGKVSTANTFMDKFYVVFVCLFLVFLFIGLALVYLLNREIRITKKDDEYERVSTEDESISKKSDKV